ncbi:MAG: HAMP domain-containing sensor histidine kinase [Gammaproteobacteria bacterium]|nr:HAMP domain-containing sensor histidine kinase [Gammaproteobacteria bacterium]
MQADSSTGELKSPAAVRIAPASQAPQQDTDELSWRILQLLNVFRVLVSVFLLLLFASVDQPRIIGTQSPTLFVAVCGLYLGVGVGNMLAVSRRWASKTIQVSWSVAFDITTITILSHASGGISSGLANLLIIIIGASALILPRKRTLMAGSMAALAILGDQAWIFLNTTPVTTDFTAAGLLSGIILIMAVLMDPLARRIQATEALARQRGVDLENLAELNQYIVQHLRESIVVVDKENQVRLMNASAANILGSPRRQPARHLSEISPRLYMLLKAWRRNPEEFRQAQPSFIAADGDRVINPQFAPLKEKGGDAMLVFLEDTSVLAEKVQQSKLASLGRLTASIAHEVRNPVGAMSHAAQLLRESAVMTSTERRLTDIIHTNGLRVSQIIDNVLQLSRRDTTAPERLQLEHWVSAFADEYCQTQQVARERLLISCAGPPPEVQIDPSHLHQVLWNLCENAIKYACGKDQVIDLKIGRLRGSDRPCLEIGDRGKGISETDAERIFEPFFTGDNGGTGLGLFICRELCECNGASLIYQPRPGGGSVFRITFSDPQRWENKT